MPDPIPTGALAVHEAKTRAVELLRAGDPTTAAQILADALPNARRDPDLLALLADALGRRGRDREAVRHAKLAAQLRPHHAPTLMILADIHRRLNEIGPAHRALDRVLAGNPGHAQALAAKARLLESRGQAERAFELLAPHALAPGADPSTVVAFAQMCRTVKRHAEGVDAVRGMLDRVEMPPDVRRSALHALGHLLDALGEYDEAFAAFDRANRMLDEHPADDPDPIIEAWTRERLEAFEPSGNASELPVLVLGMPRSGTTLTEQILSSHPSVQGVGESLALPTLMRRLMATGVSSEGLRELGSKYVDDLTGTLADPARAARVVDKMPGNYAYLGFLGRALPNASVIHCIRDARDTVLSCFFQDFGWLQPFSTRLETCARQYLAYRKLMAHWEDVADVRVLESRYGELVEDPEPRVRAMLEHIGVPFDKACLHHHQQKSTVTTASAAQVRNPIYRRSKARWRNYEKHLGPMLEILADI